MAAENNNVNLVVFLLENGANPNVFNSIGMTPLLYALQNENYDLANYLIGNGAEINFLSNYYQSGETDRLGRDISIKIYLTPLIWAIETPELAPQVKLNIIKFLLENNANTTYYYRVNNNNGGTKLLKLNKRVFRQTFEENPDLNYENVQEIKSILFPLKSNQNVAVPPGPDLGGRRKRRKTNKKRKTSKRRKTGKKRR